VENRWPFGCPNIEAGRAVRSARILLRQGYGGHVAKIGNRSLLEGGRLCRQQPACEILAYSNYIVDLVN
jgi:hypothetical protein